MKDAMSLCLKAAGVARTAAISLSGLEFADNLSATIKTHADKVEQLYGEAQKALKSSASEKELKRFLKDILQKGEATEKLQATIGD